MNKEEAKKKARELFRELFELGPNMEAFYIDRVAELYEEIARLREGAGGAGSMNKEEAKKLIYSAGSGPMIMNGAMALVRIDELAEKIVTHVEKAGERLKKEIELSQAETRQVEDVNVRLRARRAEDRAEINRLNDQIATEKAAIRDRDREYAELRRGYDAMSALAEERRRVAITANATIGSLLHEITWLRPGANPDDVIRPCPRCRGKDGKSRIGEIRQCLLCNGEGSRGPGPCISCRGSGRVKLIRHDNGPLEPSHVAKVASPSALGCTGPCCSPEERR